jgi:hypothetical protein
LNDKQGEEARGSKLERVENTRGVASKVEQEQPLSQWQSSPFRHVQR